MLPFYLLGLLLLLAPYGNGTPLDDYINKPDTNYKWHDTGLRLKGWFIGGSWEGVVLNMTSQAWLSLSEVDRTIWTHYLVIVRPNQIAYEETSFMLIGGGNNANEPPTATDSLLLLVAALAVKTKTLASILYQVPNQPVHFVSDREHLTRSEDDIIAYTWRHFFQDPGRVEWPAHIPMTKATIRAMDTVQAYASQHLDLKVESFVIGGASKRGWTTWLAGAVDKRVVGIVPMVMDLLKSVENLHHFYRSLGGWPISFMPYHLCNVTANLDTLEFSQLMAIVDPYVYIDRLTMPKLLISSSNDEFFLLDDTYCTKPTLPTSWNVFRFRGDWWNFYFFWNELKGEKHHLILPNTDHSLATGFPKLLASIEAFHLSIAMDRWKLKCSVKLPLNFMMTIGGRGTTTRPNYWWEIDKTFGSLIVHTSEEPLKVLLWSAHTIPSNGRRDFRWLTADLGNCSTFTVSGMCFQPIFFQHRKLKPTILEKFKAGFITYIATISMPKEGYAAFYVELKFQGPQRSSPFIFSTEAVIVPDDYPFSDCNGVRCNGALV